MGRKRLSWWERRIRQRGVPPIEWLSVVALLALGAWYGADDFLMYDCLGMTSDQFRGRRGQAIRVPSGLLCSPLYALDGLRGWSRLIWLFPVLAWVSGMVWLEVQRRRYWFPRMERANALARKRRAEKRKAKMRVDGRPPSSS